MPVQESISYSHPLDVLGRFMPAPVKGRLFLHDEIVTVETNDFEFLASLPNACSEIFLSQPATFQWKLLRDANVLDGIAKTTIFKAENLVIVSMGPALFAGLDVERKELLAFVGGAVSAQEYQNRIVPVFIQLTKFAMGRETITEICTQQDHADGCMSHA